MSTQLIVSKQKLPTLSQIATEEMEPRQGTSEFGLGVLTTKPGVDQLDTAGPTILQVM